MSHIAILGRQPELGLVELESILGAESITPFGVAALLAQSVDISRLGSTIKLGRIINQQPFKTLDDIEINLDSLPAATGKLNFGVSYYGGKLSEARLQSFGLTLKKRLQSRGSVRLVPTSGLELNAAQLKYNQIPSKGFELLIIINGGQAVVALTEQFQDIDWYSLRDYGRPARSAVVGMLPPKLAQVMVNSVGFKSIFDPFCGTGVVLQEALLMGRGAAGSDLSPEMIQATQTNLEWLKQKVPSIPDWSTNLADARKVQIPSGSAVVSEGYLGPNLNPGQTIAQSEVIKLSELYLDILKNFASQQQTGDEITICAPTWGNQKLPVIDQLPDLGYTLKVFKHADSRRLIYLRPGQSVGRQLLILTRQ